MEWRGGGTRGVECVKWQWQWKVAMAVESGSDSMKWK